MMFVTLVMIIANAAYAVWNFEKGDITKANWFLLIALFLTVSAKW